MPERFRLTRRPPVAVTEDGSRRPKRFAADAGLDETKTLSLRFAHFDSVTDAETPGQRLRLFTQDPEARKAWAVRHPHRGIWVFVPKRSPRCAPTRPRGPHVAWAAGGPGRLLLGRSSAPQPVPHWQRCRFMVKKILFFLAKIPHGGAGV